jgi:hypothetical protein
MLFGGERRAGGSAIVDRPSFERPWSIVVVEGWGGVDDDDDQLWTSKRTNKRTTD